MKYLKSLNKMIYKEKILKVCILRENEFSEGTKRKWCTTHGCAFLLDLFNLYNGMILRGLEDFPAFIIRDVTLTYAIHTTQRLNFKKSESMVVNKRDTPTCELQSGDVKMKQMQKCKYLGSINIDNSMTRRTWIAKDAFQKRR